MRGIILIGGLSVAVTCSTGTNAEMPAADHAPRTVIESYMQLGLTENKPLDAIEKYVSPNLKQHSPNIPDGKKALLDYIAQERSKPSAAHRESKLCHMLVQADLVLIHRLVKRGHEDPGTMYADLFRVKDGQIVEHWDVVQPVPTGPSANGHDMCATLTH